MIVSNAAGSGATVGMVTVSDSLPTGLTATAKTLLPGGMLRFRYKSNSPITVN